MANKSKEIKKEAAEVKEEPQVKTESTTEAEAKVKEVKEPKAPSFKLVVRKVTFDDEDYHDPDEENEDYVEDYRMVYDYEVILQKVRGGYMVYVINPDGESRISRPHGDNDYYSYRFGGLFKDYDEAEDFFLCTCEKLEYRY